MADHEYGGNARPWYENPLISLVAPYDPLAMEPAVRFEGPSLAHLAGTDECGCDVLSRLIYGARISLEVGVISVGISLVIGAILGLVAGYYGQMVDMLISRLMDVLFAFPAILLAIALMAMLGSDIRNVMLAIGIVNVPIFMRVARASTLTVRTTQYVEAARASGARDLRLLGRHVLPNIAAPRLCRRRLPSRGRSSPRRRSVFLDLEHSRRLLPGESCSAKAASSWSNLRPP